jgi:hypothetical protein
MYWFLHLTCFSSGIRLREREKWGSSGLVCSHYRNNSNTATCVRETWGKEPTVTQML